MTKNLERADTVVKLTLAVSVIILYGSGIISGPFAVALTVLAVITLVIFVVKILYVSLRRPPGRP